MAISIWKDTYYESPTAGVATTFQIRTENSTSTGELIYQGTVYPKSSTDKATFKINDICADYLQGELPTCNDVEFVATPGIYKTFYIFATVSGTTTALGNTTFVMDWSYDRGYTLGTYLSAPVRKSFVSGQILMVSYWNAPSIITGTIYNADGSTVNIQEPRSANADFNADFNSDFFVTSVSLDSVGVLAINMAHYPSAVKVVIGTMSYTLVTGCYRYVLHYINAYGGWDSIWMSSGVITDAYTRKTSQRLINNSTASARGKVNFANPYTHKWQLHTGWLLNTEGEMMHHLLGSTNVYLQDMEAGEMLPVNITDNSCEYKSYRSNNCKLVDYTINCELAQERKRL